MKQRFLAFDIETAKLLPEALPIEGERNLVGN